MFFNRLLPSAHGVFKMIGDYKFYPKAVLRQASPFKRENESSTLDEFNFSFCGLFLIKKIQITMLG